MASSLGHGTSCSHSFCRLTDFDDSLSADTDGLLPINGRVLSLGRFDKENEEGPGSGDGVEGCKQVTGLVERRDMQHTYSHRLGVEAAAPQYLWRHVASGVAFSPLHLPST